MKQPQAWHEIRGKNPLQLAGTRMAHTDASGSGPPPRATLKNILEKIELDCIFLHFQRKEKNPSFLFSFFHPLLFSLLQTDPLRGTTLWAGSIQGVPIPSQVGLLPAHLPAGWGHPVLLTIRQAWAGWAMPGQRWSWQVAGIPFYFNLEGGRPVTRWAAPGLHKHSGSNSNTLEKVYLVNLYVFI